MVINITKITIFTIAIIITIMAISHREEGVMFVAKKLVTLKSIQILSNKKQKNWR